MGTTADFTFDRDETIGRLRDSFSTVESFLKLVPQRWTHDAPDGSPDGSWGVAMNLAHLIAYEEQLAMPIIAAMAAGGDGHDAVPNGGETWLLDIATPLAAEPLAALASRWRAARERQIAIIESMPLDRFNAPKTMLFSARSGGQPHPVSWVATKTFQHTWEHGNAILRIALFTPR